MRDNDLTLMFPEAKGCTTKAGADAYRKLRSSTWPPSLQARVQ